MLLSTPFPCPACLSHFYVFYVSSLLFLALSHSPLICVLLLPSACCMQQPARW